MSRASIVGAKPSAESSPDVTPLEEDGRSLVTLRNISRRKTIDGSVRRHASDLEALVEARTQELDEARKRHRTLYDLAPVLDFDLDSQSSIASANRKACLSLGVPIDRLVGLPLADLARPEARAELIASLEKVRGGSLAPFEAKLRGGDGATIDVVFHACRETPARPCDSWVSTSRNSGKRNDSSTRVSTSRKHSGRGWNASCAGSARASS